MPRYPAVIDRLLAVILIATCLVSALNIAVLGNRRIETPLLWLALLSAVSLAALNQHRLQPWHWLFVLIVAQVVMLKEAECRRLNFLTIASVYIFAGLSRLGFHAADGMARQILSLLLNTIGLEEILRNENAVYWLCVGMTLSEAAIGCLLLNQTTRRTGFILSIAMHIFLLLVLGPFGLKHHVGVQVWNLFFVIAVPILFARRHEPQQSNPITQVSWRERSFAAFVILFPLSGLFGMADNWLSWQVYSPRPEVVRVFVNNSAVEGLPEPLKKFLGRSRSSGRMDAATHRCLVAEGRQRSDLSSGKIRRRGREGRGRRSPRRGRQD